MNNTTGLAYRRIMGLGSDKRVCRSGRRVCEYQSEIWHHVMMARARILIESR